MNPVVYRIARTVITLWVVIFITWHAACAGAATLRGTAAPKEFRKYNACPSTKKFTGACPGWIMDHLEALRCGGKDVPENLWWMTKTEAALKDLQEAQCWRYYKGPRK
jgi:hypothetical protein